jgi:hypothetical protein
MALTTQPRTTLLIAISVVLALAMLFANGVVAADGSDERSTGAAAAPGDATPEGTDPAPTTAGVMLAAIVVAFLFCVIG